MAYSTGTKTLPAIQTELGKVTNDKFTPKASQTLVETQAQVTALQAALAATQGDLTTAQGDLTTAQRDLTTAQGALTTATAQLADIADAWTDWVPTLTWAMANPTGVTTIARYKQVGKTVYYLVKIDATDGNGAFQLGATLPIAPKANNINPNVGVVIKIDSTNEVQHGYVRDDGANNDLWVVTGTLTDAVQVRMSGFYEIE